MTVSEIVNVLSSHLQTARVVLKGSDGKPINVVSVDAGSFTFKEGETVLFSEPCAILLQEGQ
jgi:hypothetical protein